MNLKRIFSWRDRYANKSGSLLELFFANNKLEYVSIQEGTSGPTVTLGPDAVRIRFLDAQNI